MLLAGLTLTALLIIGLVSQPAQNDANIPAAAGVATGNPQMVSESVQEAPVLGVVVDGNMRVLQVEAGGAAEKVGIRAGNLLVALGGTALTSPSAGKNLIGRAALAAQGSPVTLPVALTRNGQPLTVTAQLKPPQRRSGMPTPTAVPYDEYYL